MICKGVEVRFHYLLRVDGKVVDSSAGHEPLRYTHGFGQILEGLEDQLEGLKRGDRRTLTVMPEKGYGPVDPHAVQRVARNAFQAPGTLKVGDTVKGQANGGGFQATVVQIGPREITLDLNHPFAGKTLQFEVEIVEVIPPAAAPAPAPA